MTAPSYISLRDAAKLLNVSQSTGRRAFYRSGIEGIRAAQIAHRLVARVVARVAGPVRAARQHDLGGRDEHLELAVAGEPRGVVL